MDELGIRIQSWTLLASWLRYEVLGSRLHPHGHIRLCNTSSEMCVMCGVVRPSRVLVWVFVLRYFTDLSGRVVHSRECFSLGLQGANSAEGQ